VRLEGGPPFGVANLAYPLESVTLDPGASLILMTDGVTEAQNAQGALFGRDRILQGGPQPGSASEICEAIRDRVRRFEAGTEATDDLTVMALRYLG